MRTRRAIAWTALALAVALVGCGGNDRPGDGAITAAQDGLPFRVYWAGKTVEGLPLAAIERDEQRETFIYGDCRPAHDEGCSPPLQIQTASVCDLNALTVAGRPRSYSSFGAASMLDYGERRLQLTTGASTVLVLAKHELAEKALESLRPLDRSQVRQLEPPSYPREYVSELRRVRDAHRRLGSVRAVRDELGISQSAVRVRLRLAAQLGPRRLHRPDTQFARMSGDSPIYDDDTVDNRSSCRIETTP
jgi:hypothetical protein